MRRIAALLCGIACLLQASDAVPQEIQTPQELQTPQKIQISKKEHADLAPGASIVFRNSTGELTVEGWDRPDVEITTVVSTTRPYSESERSVKIHDLEAVKISVATQTDGLAIDTAFPRHRRFLPRPSVGTRDFDLEYHVFVPRGTKISVDHDAGELHFINLTGDIHAAIHQGMISLQVPSDARYSIDARSTVGDVTSDFPVAAARHQFGHQLLQTDSSTHSLFLRIGYGDIVILKSHRP